VQISGTGSYQGHSEEFVRFNARNSDRFKTLEVGAELAPVSLDTTLFNGTEKERGS
jgi:hypothetical protein